jgi:hypothetical protein
MFDVRLAPSPQTIGKSGETVYEADDTRPIVLTEEPRTPVTTLEPLTEVPPGPSTLEGWRPLGEKVQKPTRKAGQVSDTAVGQQIRVWQQAALLGLTSAALAMLMLERLITEQDENTD